MFVAWMVLLAHAWGASAHTMNTHTHAWYDSQLQALALAQSDALIDQSNPNPWWGCAVYSNEKHRVEEQVLDEACLRQLGPNPPNPRIVRVSLIQNGIKTDYFSRPSPGEYCVTLRRLVEMSSSGSSALLEVQTCE